MMLIVETVTKNDDLVDQKIISDKKGKSKDEYFVSDASSVLKNCNLLTEASRYSNFTDFIVNTQNLKC